MAQPDGGATAELVEQLVGRAQALGLTWQMVKATVATGHDPAEVIAILDGDTVPIGMISMIGTIPVGARVWVIVVPPGGNYITGMVDEGGPRWLGAQLCNAGTAASSTLTTEVAIPSGTWNTEPTYLFPPLRMFKVTATFEVVPSGVGPNLAFVKVRRGSASVVNTILSDFVAEMSSASTASFVSVGYFANSTTSPVSTKLSLTIARISGAATLSLFGTQALASQRIITLGVEEIGPSNMTGLSGLVAQL